MVYLVERHLRERTLEVTTQELEASNTDLKRFASVVTHDIKSPLTNMVELTALIQEDAADVLSDETRSYLDNLTKSSVELQSYVDGLLAHYTSNDQRNSQPGSFPIEALFALLDQMIVRDGSTGMGVGLATVNALLNRLGGSISLQAAPGQGSTFTATVPQVRAQQKQTKMTEDQDCDVLVVDDDATFLALINRRLRDSGLTFKSLSSGTAALAYLNKVRGKQIRDSPGRPSGRTPVEQNDSSLEPGGGRQCFL